MISTLIKNSSRFIIITFVIKNCSNLQKYFLMFPVKFAKVSWINHLGLTMQSSFFDNINLDIFFILKASDLYH